MDIMTKARELGQAIATSTEMTRLKDSEIKLENDTKAKELMKEYKQCQLEVVKASKLRLSKDETDPLKIKLMQKQDEINEYTITNEYLDAKSNFDKFMKIINDVITFTITGEEPCSSGNCGSCGGCGK